MQLRNARLCLDCEEVHDAAHCPVCASESFAFITRWVPSPSGEASPAGAGVPPVPAARVQPRERPPQVQPVEPVSQETLDTYRQLLSGNPARQLELALRQTRRPRTRHLRPRRLGVETAEPARRGLAARRSAAAGRGLIEQHGARPDAGGVPYQRRAADGARMVARDPPAAGPPADRGRGVRAQRLPDVTTGRHPAPPSHHAGDARDHVRGRTPPRCGHRAASVGSIRV